MSTAADARPLPGRDQTGEARCDSLTHDGRAVARVNGKTTFIEGALPGERVRFRYLRKRARYDTAALVDILEPSPQRVTPPCPAFGVCGGCTEQHLAPAAQVRAKQQVLADALAHVGRVAPAHWLEPITGPASGYRRRARLGVRFVPKKGGVLVGFRERRSSYVTPLASCVTLDPGFSALLAPLRALISGLSRPDRLPQIEISAGESARALIFRHLEPLTGGDLERLRGFARAHDAAVYLQPGGPETVAPLWPLPPPELDYALPAFDLWLAFGPTDFVQVNGAVNRLLVERAVGLLAPGAGEHVVDLFCGIGNFTLALARRARRVTGYEADPALIRRAEANAQRNGIANAAFRVADLYGPGLAGVYAAGVCDKLLLDPPRAGAIEALKAMPAPGPARIVYVSCNPATLARDSEYLVQARGYRLEAAGIADMFPHTSHVESLALFSRT